MTNSRARPLIATNGDVTIATGSITQPTGIGCLTVDTEASASTDDLTTIEPTSANQIILIRSKSSARDPTIKDEGAGSLHIAGDFTFTNAADFMMLYALLKASSGMYEISRSDNTT